MEEKLIRKQIKETKDMIVKTSVNNEFYLTLLINSLLSLIVLPIEELKRKPREKVFGSSFIEFQKNTGVTPIIFKPIKEIENNTVVYHKRTPQKFVEKLRNGIAHQCIEIKEADTFYYVIIYNFYIVKKKRIRDFEIKLSPVELKKLALFIANCYLKVNKSIS